MHHGHCYTLAPADQGVCMVVHNNLLIQTTCTVYCNIAGALGFPGHRDARTAARLGHPCLQSLAQIVGHIKRLKAIEHGCRHVGCSNSCLGCLQRAHTAQSHYLHPSDWTLKLYI